MQQRASRPWTAAVVALVSVGAAGVAGAPAAAPSSSSTSWPTGVGLAAGEVDITLDFVRHGQSQDNVDGILGTVPPGAPLTAVGEQQAIAVGQGLYNGGDNDIAGTYASELLRTQQTAWPLVQLLAGTGDSTDIPAGPPPLLDPGQILSGLNEINAGLLEGQPLNTFTEIAYIAPAVLWILGNYWVPQLGSSIDPNGAAFTDRVADAVQTIYDNTVNDVSDGDGKLTDVAFAHAGTIAAWTLMNVRNPDLTVVINELLDTRNPVANTGQVVLVGNPSDGWTLVSWDGHDVAPTPDLFGGLFVDWRDLIVAPQLATWRVWDAVVSGDDPAAITAAIQTGFDDVVAAIIRFPQAVFETISGAFTAGPAVPVEDVSQLLATLLAD